MKRFAGNRGTSERAAELGPFGAIVVGQQSESELIAAARSGDEYAFALLCASSRAKILGILVRITSNVEDAEDAMQDALLSAFRNLPGFQGKSRFSTWLTRVAINTGLMTLRKKRARREDSLLEDHTAFGKSQAWDVPDQTPNPERRYLMLEQRGFFQKAIDKLSPALRATADLHLVQNCSMRETAGILGISESATKGRLFRARLSLRRAAALNNMYRPNCEQTSNSQWAKGNT